MEEIIKAIRDRMFQDIERVGWSIQNVLPGESATAYSYTIGLSAKCLPELIVVGMHPAVADDVLKLASEKQVALARFEDGVEQVEILSVPLVSKAVDQDDAFDLAVGARRFAIENGHPFALVHLVYPDAQGLFPWQDGCDPKYRTFQDLEELLRRSAADQAGELPLDSSERSSPRAG